MLGRKKAKKKARKAKKAKRIIRKTIFTLGAVYAGAFCVFFFDLDGKLLYYVVEPFLKNHYDNMERRDPHTVPYDLIPDDKEYV